ncbi:ESAT-6 like protein EsxS, partial [Mycobacterium tuberculosis TB_RSA119]
MSLLDAHIPQLIASHTAFAAKAGLMRHTNPAPMKPATPW